MADTGDNLRFRPSVSLWVFPEDDPGDLTRIEVTYPDGPHDVEALVIDPADGTPYLFTKGARSQVFAVGSDGRTTLVTTVPLAFVTGADVSADGRTLAVLAVRTTHVWRRAPGQSWAGVLARPADCVLDAGRGEAVAFELDGTALVTLPEGAGSPLARTSIA